MAASDRTAVRRKLRALHRRHQRVVAAMTACEQERTALYIEARRLVPPLTYKEIAGIFQVTEAAVMQKVKRHEERTRPKKKRRPAAAAPEHVPEPESEPVSP